MSSSKASTKNGVGKTPKRALPSWMSGRDDESEKEIANDSMDDDGKVNVSPKKAKGEGSRSREETPSASSSTLDFSKLLDGVVFVLSGFVNPERSTLRSHALEMGAEYQADWNSKCTLLVCAFRNTPKFRQVEADSGTIVSKDWITECYTQRKLVEIETYLMNVGKPWRKRDTSLTANKAHESSPPSIPRKREAKRPKVEPNRSTFSKATISGTAKYLKETFSPSNVKKWAVDDLNKTLSWLESQEEKPEASEIRNVAAQGILTCLQDAIDLLEKKQDLKQLTEQWNTVPYVVEELIKIQDTMDSSLSDSKGDFHELALTCKKIYMDELKGQSNTSSKKSDKSRSDNRNKGKGGNGKTQKTTSNSTGYDSDETIEMTEEEIDNAYRKIVSTMPKS